MALNIKDQETEKLAAEVAELTGESKTGAVREALRRNGTGWSSRGRAADLGRRGILRGFSKPRSGPRFPEELRGTPMTKAEREEILGYGPEG